MSDGLARLAGSLGYSFQNTALLETALTHRSAGSGNNERLEYLGDAILNFLIAETLYRSLPRAPEGVLTRLRATLVKRETLAEVAREIDLGPYIVLGDGERKSGGWRRDSILSNTLESVLGAVYLDSGIDTARAMVLRLFAARLADLPDTSPDKDPKTTLQELLQSRRLPLPAYRIVAEEGEAHERLFRVECDVAGLVAPVVAEGRSKRNAEQAAAAAALARLAEQAT